MNKIINFCKWFIYEPACPRKLIKIDNPEQERIMREVINDLNKERVHYYLCSSLLRIEMMNILGKIDGVGTANIYKLKKRVNRCSVTISGLSCWRPWAFDRKKSRIKWVEESLKQYYNGEKNESK